MIKRLHIEQFSLHISSDVISRNSKFIDIYSDADCSRLDLSEISLVALDFSRVNFSYANFFKANLERACLKKSKLEGATLDQAVLEHANLSKVIGLEPKQLMKAKFEKVIIDPLDRENIFLVRLVNEKRKRRKERAEHKHRLSLLEAMITKVMNNQVQQASTSSVSNSSAGGNITSVAITHHHHYSNFDMNKSLEASTYNSSVCS